jgi:hypothetical protein
MEFSFEGLDNGGNGKEGIYIYPGIHKVKILGFEKGASSGGNDQILMKAMTLKAEEEGISPDDCTRTFYYPTAGNAWDHTRRRLAEITNRVSTTIEDKVKAVKSLDEFIAVLNAEAKNKPVRLKFTGAEKFNEPDKLKVETAFYNAAEAIIDGAKYPAVSDEDSKLTFDKSNEKDYPKSHYEKEQSTNNASPDLEETVTESGGVDWMNS